MLTTKAWKRIYEYFEWISDYEPWENIRETDPIVIERPGKRTVYVRILGDKCEQCGIACYFTLEDYLASHAEQTYLWCEDEHYICQQNALIGLWGFEEYVSRFNMNILKELEIYPDGNDLLPHFDKYEYGYVPDKIKKDEAEELEEILKHVYLMLEAVYGKNRKVKFPENQVLMRLYDAEGKKWITGFGEHTVQEALQDIYMEITDPRTVNLKNMKGKGTWNVLMDLGFDIQTDPETKRKYYETAVCVQKVLPKSSKVIFDERFTPDDMQNGALYGVLYTLSEKLGKPKTIEFTDKDMEYKLVDFCRKADIQLVDRVDEALDSLQQFVDEHKEELDALFRSWQAKEENALSADIDCSETENKSYVLSVSMGTGLYRHICISANATFEELHEAILDAYGFSDDHLHMFTVKPAGSFREMELFSKYMEDAEMTTDAYVLAQILQEGMKFKYLFDFGDAWEFTVKVLHLNNVPCSVPMVLRSKGEAPQQYPDLE